MATLVFKRESKEGTRHPWCELQVISDDRVVIVDMTPALLGGWRYGRTTVQGHDDWQGYTAEQIIASKRQDTRCDLQPLEGEDAARVLAWLQERGL